MRSVIPRRTISSASSRWLQWLIGRPEPLGCSQASARIWHTCSALRRGWTPGRGASASRLATLTSSSGMPRQPIQRRRQSPTASTSIGTCSAIAVLLYPIAASSTTRARLELTVLRVAQLNLRRPRSRHALHLVSKMVHPSRPPQSSGSPPPFCTSGFVIGTSRPTPARAAVKLSTKKGCVVRVIHVPIREGLSGILIAMKPFSGTSRGMWRPSDRDATHLERRTPGNGYAVSSLALETRAADQP